MLLFIRTNVCVTYVQKSHAHVNSQNNIIVTGRRRRNPHAHARIHAKHTQGSKSRINIHDIRDSAPPALDPSHYINARVRVLFDDGVLYQGTITGHDDKSDKFFVRLDDGTRFTTHLPDPDIDVISGPMSPRLGAHDTPGEFALWMPVFVCCLQAHI